MRVFIIDNCEIFRKGLKVLLQENFPVEAFGEAHNFPVLLEGMNYEQWDIIIMDIEFPDNDGLEILKYINGINSTLPILVLTYLHPEHYAIRAFKSGASGFLSKALSCNEIIDAVKVIYSGKKYINGYVEDYFSKMISKNFAETVELLSNREYHIFIRIAEGYTVSEIARELSLSVKTISHYRKNILQKMNLKNNAGIMRYAFTNKFIK
ncbi:MAG: response regulator transcription factor [Ignavibacteriaceae bacterium]